MKTLQFRNSIYLSFLRSGSILLGVLLTCFVLSPAARAVDPPPDGGYPNENTAEGDNALFNLTTGARNTATGFEALYSDTTGEDNTATGSDALSSNTIGTENTASGSNALTLNTEGSANTASGFEALYSNTTGISNTATGFIALNFNDTGTRNTATGAQALWFNTTGRRNTATGFDALAFNDVGNHNSAYGWVSLFFNTTGNLNIALGDAAGYNLHAGDNNIYIGNQGVTTESNTTRIGNQAATVLPDGTVQPAQAATYIAGIYGVGVTGVPVKINSAGQLGTTPSSARFKEEIKPMADTSQAILALRPVTFRHKKDIDPERNQQFGLVAEEVAKINEDLVARDAQGKIYTVRYDAVNAMLLNEFLKEHRRNEKQETMIAELKTEIATLSASVKKQDSRLQKVSAQLELSKPAPQRAASKD